MSHPASLSSNLSWHNALWDSWALLGAVGGLWLVHVFGYTLTQEAMLAIWALLGVLIAIGLFRRARIRRAALLAAYLHPESPLARWLRGGIVLATRQLLLGGVLAALLIVGVLRIEQREVWWVLLGSVPLLVLLRLFWTHLLRREASTRYLPELAWRLALTLTAATMIAVLVVLAFHRAYPDVSGATLEQAVWYWVDREQARSDWLQLGLQLDAAKDAVHLWLAQQWMPDPGTSLADGLGWLIVLIDEALFVWAHLMLASSLVRGLSVREAAHDCG